MELSLRDPVPCVAGETWHVSLGLASSLLGTWLSSLTPPTESHWNRAPPSPVIGLAKKVVQGFQYNVTEHPNELFGQAIPVTATQGCRDERRLRSQYYWARQLSLCLHISVLP